MFGLILVGTLAVLTFSAPEKLKNSIFEIPITPETLNISNQRTTSTKSINLDIIRKLIEYSLKNVFVKAMFTLTVFEIQLFEGRSVRLKEKVKTLRVTSTLG